MACQIDVQTRTSTLAELPPGIVDVAMRRLRSDPEDGIEHEQAAQITMRKIGNIVYRTDCIFHEYNGAIEVKQDYRIIRAPTNPGFWFGNFILFNNAPEEGDFKEWLDIHRTEFVDTVNHITLAWESEERGYTQIFEEHGFTVFSEIDLRAEFLTTLRFLFLPPSHYYARQVETNRCSRFARTISSNRSEFRKTYFLQSRNPFECLRTNYRAALRLIASYTL
jgi:hypothetical protein